MRPLQFLFVWCLLALHHCLRPALSAAFTFMEPDSYAEYPRWRTSQDGLAEFLFRTSQTDGLLFYLDSITSESRDYLAVWLEDGRLRGRMEAGGSESEGEAPLETTFGEHRFNDLVWHELHIRHFQNKFEFYVDGSLQGNLTYDLQLRFETGSSVYVGGLPSSYDADFEAVTTFKSLAGCVRGVKFANDSIQQLMLRARDPDSQNGLLDGCLDGCGGASSVCNGGECVKDWASPGGFFCDCSQTSYFGRFCNTTSTPSDWLRLTGDGYYCYSPSHQPFTDHHGNLVVQLQAPLPSTGTVVTGHSENWIDWFNLFLQDSRLHYELRIGTNEYAATSNFQVSTSGNYQISLTRTGREVSILIQVVSSNNQIVTVNEVPPLTTSETIPEFTSVCIGGGAMEVPVYVGVMERVFVGHVALLEQNSTRVENASLINLSGDFGTPPLNFTKHGLRSDRISFQFRLPVEVTDGVLLRGGNELAELSIAIFGGEIFIQAGIEFVFCLGITVVDDEWHHFKLVKAGSPTSGVVMTIDGASENSCRLNMSAGVTQHLESNSSILELGAAASGPMAFGNSIPFAGCFHDIQFVSDGETFRPNLEVPIMRYERFHGDGCYGCSEDDSQEARCVNGGVCQNTGAFKSPSCNCSKEFLGERCEEVTESPTAPPSPPVVVTSTNTPSPSAETTPPTEKPTIDDMKQEGDGIDYDALGQWVGIATAIILVLILLVILMVFIGCFVHSQRVRGSGFYRTHENTASVMLPHFSASLKTAHSHTLNLEQNRVTAITNGRTVHPTYASGEKEFYI